MGQFQIAPRRCIKLQQLPRTLLAWWAQQRQAAFLRQFQIIDQRTHRAQLGAGELPKPVQRADIEHPRNPRLGAAAVEAGGGKLRHGGADLFDGCDARGLHPVGNQHLTRQ